MMFLADDRGNQWPDFFEQAPILRVQDDLARFLGAAGSGVLTYQYVDAVRLAGHSCPTVAGAYLMAIKGLRVLHSAELPQRGEIEVCMSQGREDGATGVIASVATLLTGAAAEQGFAGMGALQRFGRRNLLRFHAPMQGVLALRRKDSGQAVQVLFDGSQVPWSDPEMPLLIACAVSGQASAQEQERFSQNWQARVKAILVDHVDDPLLIQVLPFNV